MAILLKLGRIVVYTSKKLKEHKKNYPMNELELESAVFALKTWRH